MAIIDHDATVENLSAILAAAIYQRMPPRVQRVMVRMFEGVGKSALAMVGVAGDAGMGLISGTDTMGRLLSVDQLLVQVEELAVRTLQVSEIFYSIQGEGASCGQAAAFIRLGGCSLGCQWCDTKYTWRGGPLWEEQRVPDTGKSQRAAS